MPNQVNPLLTGDVEQGLGFFDDKLRNGDTVPEYMSAMRAPTMMATKTLEMGRDYTTTYPRSSHYSPPDSNASSDFMKKYSREYGQQMGWYDTPSLDVDLNNLDLTPRAADMFTSFDTFEGTFNNVKLTGDMIECLAYADPEMLMQMFMQWGPPDLVRIVMFVKSAISIYKVKINSFRDLVLGLLLPIVARPLMEVFISLDQLVSLGYNNVMSFANTLKMSQNTFCTISKEDKETSKMEEIRSTFNEASQYIEEGATNIRGWYEGMRSDIMRAVTANSKQMEEASNLVRKVAITKQIIDIVKDTVGT